MTRKSNLPALPGASAKNALAARETSFARGIEALRRGTGQAESRSLIFVCTVTGKHFTGVFERFSPKDVFRIARLEPCAEISAQDGAVARWLGLAPPGMSVFRAAEFDVGGWKCLHCGTPEQVIVCAGCGELTCAGRTYTHASGKVISECHDGCGSSGYLAGPAQELSGRAGGGARLLPSPGRGLLSGPSLPLLGGPKK